MPLSRSTRNPGRPTTGLLTGSVRERRVPLRGRFTKQVASCCMARMLVLAAESRQRAIVAYIDSPGGVAAEALGVISTMDGIRSPVATFCCGAVSGPAIVIAAHGLRGFRVAVPTCRFSFKGFDSAAPGPKTPGAEAFFPLLAETLAQDTRKQKAEVLEWLRTGAEFNAQEALRAGLIDLVSTQPVLPDSA
jgi:ATP-dependent Clp protease, protease subunit